MDERDELLREILARHLHPEQGSRYWLRRQDRLGFDVRDQIRHWHDLPRLGLTRTDELSRHSVWDLLPRGWRHRKAECLVSESGGTSGGVTASVFLRDDFQAAFIHPFLDLVGRTGFPTETEWLWIGPSGPHIIGKVVRELARQTGCPDPWSVDFDPRWIKRLVPGSFAARRYLDHVLEQARTLLRRERPAVLFTTPPVLDALAETLSAKERVQFTGIHYGGMKVEAEQVNRFHELFPQAVHLSGYGNSLCGVCLEAEDRFRTTMDYFSPGNRLFYSVVRLTEDGAWEEVAAEEKGRVMFHRLDNSSFLPNVLERDCAVRIDSSSSAIELGWTNGGLRDPGPPVSERVSLKTGLY